MLGRFFVRPAVLDAIYNVSVRCTKCEKEKEESELIQSRAAGDSRKPRRICCVCRNAQRRIIAKKRAVGGRRSSSKTVPYWIWQDSRHSDVKYKRSNDLTVVDIASIIEGGCNYCGASDIRMTLDRIDNAIGHTITNVIPACIRCNYQRRDMPINAWKVIAKAMREARELGLFGDWIGGVKIKK